MADQGSGQDRTEEATPKRLDDARKKGQIPRSRELGTLALLLTAASAMVVLGPMLVDGLNGLLTHSLSFDYTRALDEHALGRELLGAVRSALLLLAPFFLLMTLIVLLSPVALGGWMFNTEMLLPKYERIDPMKGFGRMFSVKSLLELLKAVSKFLLVAMVLLLVFKLVLVDVIRLPLQEVIPAVSSAGSLLVRCFIAFSVVLIIVVLIDVPYQLWDHKRQLKMTKQEIRDEMKETEGRPEVKSAIRAKQQEIASRRMMEKVPTADVIITNPTHYAVAIKYDQEGSGAPIVVAKGKDHIAARIREIAKENRIAIFSAPPLARALYASTDLDKEIPENLFVAVAQVLAYIFQLRQVARGTSKVIPHPPTNIKVPEEYTRKEQQT